MFVTWSLAEAWSWVVNLPFLGGLVLISPVLGVMIAEGNSQRHRAKITGLLDCALVDHP